MNESTLISLLREYYDTGIRHMLVTTDEDDIANDRKHDRIKEELTRIYKEQDQRISELEEQLRLANEERDAWREDAERLANAVITSDMFRQRETVLGSALEHHRQLHERYSTETCKACDGSGEVGGCYDQDDGMTTCNECGGTGNGH